jgi:hypothetical protein
MIWTPITNPESEWTGFFTILTEDGEALLTEDLVEIECEHGTEWDSGSTINTTWS